MMDTKDINPDAYHTESWKVLHSKATFKSLAIALVRAILAVDIRLSQLVAIEKHRNNLISADLEARYAKTVESRYAKSDV